MPTETFSRLQRWSLTRPRGYKTFFMLNSLKLFLIVEMAEIVGSLPIHLDVPYSTFLAPCALNFFRVAANFLSKFFSFKRTF